MPSSSSSSPETSNAAPSSPKDSSSYKYETHEEVLDDLSSRFILNLPEEELASLERICFQVEQAHWFYEDFIREVNPQFPSLPLKKFSAMLFHACPLLRQWSHDHEQAFNTFMQYKTRVPVCGAIMLNDTWEKCVLVKGWKSSSGWGFPKGKINEDEPATSCAIREVLEETGYNLAGQVEAQDVIEMSIREQKISLYIVPNVPEDYPFKTKTRKEISKIEWFRLTDLPTWKRNKALPGKFYLISPFIGALKAFIQERKPRKIKSRKGAPTQHAPVLPKTVNASPPLYVKYHDATQESSSQSSSADNGDPHTPSPQYSESVANHVPCVADNDTTQTIPDGIDPHLTRLLSSLTMSANPLSPEKSDITPLSIKTNECTAKESTTPIPITASSSGSHPAPMDRDDWSSSAPTRLSDRSVEPSIPLPLNTDPSPTTINTNPPSTSSRSQPPTALNLNHHVPSSSAGPQILPTSPHSAALSPTISLSSPSNPTKTMGSRRTSSTADISPYLSKSLVMPTNGRHMAQLALLESVADESAKMTPFLHAHGTSVMNGTNPRPFVSGLPSTSVPPPAMPMHRDPNDLRVIYSSAAPVGLPLPPPPAPSASSSFYSPHRSLMMDDAFQVRPRTSHAFHRGPMYPPPPGSVSMNQGQLLALMNNGAPAQNGSMYRGPPPPPQMTSQFRQPYHPTPPPYTVPLRGPPPHSQPPHHQMNGFTVNNPQLPFSPPQPPLGPPPQSAPAMTPGFTVVHPNAPPPPPLNRNANLLSILNGARQTPGPAPALPNAYQPQPQPPMTNGIQYR